VKERKERKIILISVISQVNKVFVGFIYISKKANGILLQKRKRKSKN